MPIIDKNGLDQLTRYEYKSSGYSLIDNLLNKAVWVHAVELLPKWMAPNLVTLLGLLCLFLSFVLTSIVTPTLSEAAPPFFFVFVALTQFVYQTLDAIDGKQSRRTVPISSSPLGQLFDHGCDSMSTFLTILPAAAAMRTGYTTWTVISLIGVQIPFFFAQWEEHFTHTLRTFVGPGIGVTEGQIGLMCILVISAVIGPDLWLTPLTAFLPSYITDVLAVVDIRSLNHMVICSIALVNVGIVTANIRCVFRTLEKPGAVSRRFALMDCIPVLILATSAFFWRNTPAFHSSPWTCLTVLGFVFSHLNTQMIIANVTHTNFPVLWQPSLWPLPFVVFNSSLAKPFLPPGIVASGYLIFAIVQIFWYLFVVIEEISSHLGIYCFSLAKRSNWKPATTTTATATPAVAVGDKPKSV